MFLHKSTIHRIASAKYITCTYDDPEGLGNQLYRFISLYGIGEQIGRLPYIDVTNFKQIKLMPNISRTFPLLNEIIKYKSPPLESVKIAEFANDCCKYEDPRRLAVHNEKYLKLSAKYLQAFNYFHVIRDNVRKILECSNAVQQTVDLWAKQMFNNDLNYKFCVHIRRGDFFDTGMLVSKEKTLYPMMRFAFKYLQVNSNQKLVKVE